MDVIVVGSDRFFINSSVILWQPKFSKSFVCWIFYIFVLLYFQFYVHLYYNWHLFFFKYIFLISLFSIWKIIDCFNHFLPSISPIVSAFRYQAVLCLLLVRPYIGTYLWMCVSKYQQETYSITNSNRPYRSPTTYSISFNNVPFLSHLLLFAAWHICATSPPHFSS